MERSAIVLEKKEHKDEKGSVLGSVCDRGGELRGARWARLGSGRIRERNHHKEVKIEEEEREETERSEKDERTAFPHFSRIVFREGKNTIVDHL